MNIYNAHLMGYNHTTRVDKPDSEALCRLADDAREFFVGVDLLMGRGQQKVSHLMSQFLANNGSIDNSVTSTPRVVPTANELIVTATTLLAKLKPIAYSNGLKNIYDKVLSTVHEVDDGALLGDSQVDYMYKLSSGDGATAVQLQEAHINHIVACNNRVSRVLQVCSSLLKSSSGDSDRSTPTATISPIILMYLVSVGAAQCTLAASQRINEEVATNFKHASGLLNLLSSFLSWLQGLYQQFLAGVNSQDAHKSSPLPDIGFMDDNFASQCAYPYINSGDGALEIIAPITDPSFPQGMLQYFATGHDKASGFPCVIIDKNSIDNFIKTVSRTYAAAIPTLGQNPQYENNGQMFVDSGGLVYKLLTNNTFMTIVNNNLQAVNAKMNEGVGEVNSKQELLSSLYAIFLDALRAMSQAVSGIWR